MHILPIIKLISKLKIQKTEKKQNHSTWKILILKYVYGSKE